MDTTEMRAEWQLPTLDRIEAAVATLAAWLRPVLDGRSTACAAPASDATAASGDTPPGWKALVDRYWLAHALMKADEQFGALAAANSAADRAKEEAARQPQAARKAQLAAVGRAEDAALDEHMERYWTPCMAAAMALARAPAPDVAALRLKVQLIEEHRLYEREEADGEMLALIAADVERLGSAS